MHLQQLLLSWKFVVVDLDLIDEAQPQQFANAAKQKEATHGTLEEQIAALKKNVPENKTLINNRPFEKFVELLEYVIFKVQQSTINYMRKKSRTRGYKTHVLIKGTVVMK